MSQCGYNTALDLLRARVPALVVPFAEGREDEQTRRAARLERCGALRVLPPERLEPASARARDPGAARLPAPHDSISTSPERSASTALLAEARRAVAMPSEAAAAR